MPRQNKLSLMADLRRIENEKPKLKKSQITNQLVYSTSTLQRYRNNVYMLSPYGIQLNTTNQRSKKVSNTNFDKTTHRDPDSKRPRLTSTDLKPTSKESSPEVKPVKTKTNLKGGANIEITEKLLDEIVQKNYL